MSKKPPSHNGAGRWSRRCGRAPPCARWPTSSAWPWPPCSAGSHGPRDSAWTGWTGRTAPCGLPVPVNRTQRQREDLVLTIRQELRTTSDLGEFGAAAIHREWRARGLPDPPALRTIGLILERRGALDRRRRVRRPAPPSGWYLPAVPARPARVGSLAALEGRGVPGGAALA